MFSKKAFLKDLTVHLIGQNYSYSRMQLPGSLKEQFFLATTVGGVHGDGHDARAADS